MGGGQKYVNLCICTLERVEISPNQNRYNYPRTEQNVRDINIVFHTILSQTKETILMQRGLKIELQIQDSLASHYQEETLKCNGILKVQLICQLKDNTLRVGELTYRTQYIH